MKKNTAIRIALIISALVISGTIQSFAKLSGLPFAMIVFGLVFLAWYSADKISAIENSDAKLYYNWCQEFLEAYMASDFAKNAIRCAKDQLSADFEQCKLAKKNGYSGYDEQYYADLDSNKSDSGTCRMWAIVYLHFRLHKGSGYMTIRPSDSEILAQKTVTKQIDELYASLIGSNDCPKSFIDAFPFE